ncbi:LemA family protein [Streptococcus merionis]|uniref:LemA family protein n=1 Tax=Streptococcus merionis TaxID=400065 RepID=UPI003515E3AB
MKQQSVLMYLLKLLGIIILATLVWVLIFSFTTTPEESDIVIEPFQGASFVFGVLTAVILSFSLHYNKTRHLEQRVDAFKSNIEIVEERNKKLLNQANRLVEKHQDKEKEAIVDVMQAQSTTSRKEATHPLKGKQIETSQEFGQFLKSMPQLRMNENIEKLLNAIFDTENQLAQSRVDYNTTVESYNSAIHQLPISLFAKLLKLKDKPYYQLSQSAEEFTDEMLGL